MFLAMGVIWGVPYLFIKLAVEYVPPASLVFMRHSTVQSWTHISWSRSDRTR